MTARSAQAPQSGWTRPGHGVLYRERVLAERERLRAEGRDLAGRQRQTLTELLEFNAGTRFGEAHGFAGLRSVDDFRAAVPIRDFAGLSPWIDRVAAGERRVLTADAPVLYFTSSGTTGAHKRIPVTRAFIRTSFLPFYYAVWAPLIEHFPEVLSAPDAVLNLTYDPLAATPATAGGKPHICAGQVDFGAQFGEPLAAELGTGAPWAVLPAEVTPAPQDHLERMYLRLRLAVQHDLRCVIGINPAMVAAVPYQLDQWLPRIVREVRDGTLGGVRLLDPDPARAAELESLHARFGTLRPAHVWPRLTALFCWTTGAATLYLPALREQFGVDVSVLPAPTAASEGPVAVALDRHRSAGTLIPSAGFYEFVPADRELTEDAPTLLPHELEAGQDYHVVFSHLGGFYRYAVGDVARVVDHHGGGPRLEYAGRGNRSDAAGERLRDAQFVRAVRDALETTGLGLRNVATRTEAVAAEAAAAGRGTARRERGAGTGPDGAAVRYRIVVEPRGGWSARETALFTAATDARLAAESPDYARARSEGRLAAPTAELVGPDTFQHDWHAAVAAGTRPTQVKDRLFRQDPATWRRLTAAAYGPESIAGSTAGSSASSSALPAALSAATGPDGAGHPAGGQPRSPRAGAGAARRRTPGRRVHPVRSAHPAHPAHRQGSARTTDLTTPVARTALLTAALRAAETARPDRLYADPYAARLVGGAGPALLGAIRAAAFPPDGPRTLPGTPDCSAIRTRFFDDLLTGAARDPRLTQIVLAPAGLDSRAYRLPWPAHIRCFEIDRPAVLNFKAARLAGVAPRVDHRTVPADLTGPAWEADLVAAGYDPGLPSLWLLEGLLFSLPEPDARLVLDRVAALSAPGSAVAADMVNSASLTLPSMRGLLEVFAGWGCPLLFGTDQPEELFARHGFAVTATQPGEPGADFGRWPDPVPDRALTDVRRVFLVHGHRV